MTTSLHDRIDREINVGPAPAPATLRTRVRRRRRRKGVGLIATIAITAGAGWGASRLTWASEDHLTALEECLQDGGYRTSVDVAAGRIDVYNPGEVTDPVDECQRDLEDAGRIDPPGEPDESDHRRWYAAYEQINACLIENAYPHEPMPTWEEFVDGDFMWHPWHTAMDTPEGELALIRRHGDWMTAFAALDATCPQDFTVWE